MQGARWTTASVHTTQWSAPQHSYEKVVAVLDGEGGGGGVARKQLAMEVLSQPGMLRVTRATHTTTRSSTKHFDDLKLSVNPLDVGAQKEKLSLGRRAALGNRRPPSRNRTPQGRQTTADLLSPSIVKSSSVDIVELDNEDNGNRVPDSSYKISFPDDDSDDSFYDSCPEKESVFKDESEHLEEWRRESKIRRSLQFPKRSTYNTSSRLADLPDNWGSVSKIKQELEKCQNHVFLPKTEKTDSHTSVVEKTNDVKETVDSIFETESIDNFTIKPSALKTKSFISVETLNEIRGKLKSLSNGTSITKLPDVASEEILDESIEDANKKPLELEKIEEEVYPAKNVKSYIFGMEAIIKSANDTTYPCGSNSLESRVSKLNGTSSKGDEWHARRKSYGFEKVQSSLKSGDSLLNREKNEIESSTDSGICRSSELVNSLHNSPTSTQVFSKPTSNGGGKTVVKLGDITKEDTFEDWLSRNRKNIANRTSRIGSVFIEGVNDDKINNVKPTNNDSVIYLKNTNDINKTSSIAENISKRHTIAVDSVKDIKQLYESKVPLEARINFLTGKNEESNDDVSEKKSKKVEFCKTEVHFAAESGKVNIVETDGKPPSTNNFRRRRRNSGTTLTKEPEKTNLPVLHFGDNSDEKKIEENVEDRLKLNYAVITEIRSNKEEANNDNINGDDGTEPRGILKNKPIKPTPYHLGEDKEIVPDSDRNLWGVKLRPVQNETPLWKSSVTLKNTTFDKNDTENAKPLELQQKLTNGVTKEEKSNKIVESKGYSTKINFGAGTPIVESSYKQADKPITSVSKDVLYQSKPTLINSRTALIYKPNCENKQLKNTVSTKITIDMSSKSGAIKSLPELKSTALVKNSHRNEVQMFLIEKSDKQNIKTAFRSKVNGFQRPNTDNNGIQRPGNGFLRPSNDQSGDSADEEVRSLMSVDREARNVMEDHSSCSWSKLRTFRSLQHCHTSSSSPSSSSLHQKSLTNYFNNNNTHLLHNRKEVKNEDVKKPLKPLTRTSPLRDILPATNSINHNNEKFVALKTLTTPIIKSVTSESNKEVKKEVTTSSNFGDSLGTPRSMLPGRGSARKLKEHELSYFGVKPPSEPETSAKITEVKKVTDDKNNKTLMQHINDEKKREEKSVKRIFAESQTKKVKSLPIYENVNVKTNSLKSNKASNHKIYEHKPENIVPVNGKHPGETIIEELTKAADEILQALNGYTDEESIIINSTDEDDEYRQTRRFSKLDTITEGTAQKSKKSENKAVQANLIYKKSSRSSTIKKQDKNSSNSSLESISREQQLIERARRKHAKTDLEKPEKVHRKKSSSGDLIKARRLQRANSRDALLQNHGSSSEDLANQNHEVVVRKRTLRRSKLDPDSKTSSKSSSTRSKVVEYSNDVSKASLKSALSVVPEIRHKTAVSTIRNISDRRSHKDKGSERSSSNHDRSRRREKLFEGTISSMAKEKLKYEKPRSADTSLDRESVHSKDNVRTYVPLSKRDTSRQRDSSNEREKTRKHEEMKLERDRRKHLNPEKQDNQQLYQNIQPITGYSRSAEKQSRSVRKITSRTE